MHLTEADKAEFSALFPQMWIVPSKDGSRIYEGEFRFIGESDKWGTFEDAYQLRIVVREDPNSLPEIFETDGRVARIDSSHINPTAAGPHTGSLCLGSYLRLRIKTGRPATLVSFAKNCIVPYLFAMSLREQGKPAFIFGELAHGDPGLLQDYEQILNVRGLARVVHALRLAAMRRRIANRQRCPCGCGKRLGKCGVHHHVNALRKAAPRSYFAAFKGLKSPEDAR